MGKALTKTAPAHLAHRIEELAAGMPELVDLTPEQLDAVTRAVLADELKTDLKRAILAAGIDWKEEREAFLSDKTSRHTRAAYRRALASLEAWLARKGLIPADLIPRLADDYIRDLRAEGKDADSSRLFAAAASSFYTFLERRYEEIRNPFRGTKARPASTWQTAEIPTPEEAEIILRGAADPMTRVALRIVDETGLRVGALAGLQIRVDGSYTTTTKGKKFNGPEPFSSEVLQAIRDAGLDAHKPFDPSRWGGRGSSETPAADRFTIAMKTRLSRITRPLAEAGRIRTAYSWHDFRHAFAERNAHRGLVWLRDRLGQSSVSVTERYLRNTLGRDTRGL